MVLRVRMCPNCGGEHIELAAGGIGGSFMCGECGFSGSVFPEKEILDEEMKSGRNGKNDKNENKKRRKKK